MCVVMVIIGKKPLDKKNNEDVTSKSNSLGPIEARTMSRGSALFSCGIMEASCWLDAALPRSSVRPKPDFGSGLDSLWCRPLEASPGHCASLSSLLHDLNLSSRTGPCSAGPPSLWPGTEPCSAAPTSLWPGTEPCSAAAPSLWPGTEPCSAAPPSKRQCRSLSCSDDLGRSTWRPQGSRLWTSVEKRRCHSGGSVQKTSAASTFPSMQRSSSVNLAFPHAPRPSSRPSPRPSPDSTPETERRRGQSSGPGLPRSQSQPCVLNEKKVGVKRRRQDDAHMRPSLDLAKMTQKLRSFHSLSCPGFSSCDNHDDRDLFHLKNSRHNGDLTTPGHRTKEPAAHRPPFCPTAEDCADAAAAPSANQAAGGAAWAGRRGSHQLGGELDIEQIERN
ncbi:protein FAM53B-like [Eucyclogobius newberryi]|uniref:protein FAM53B-like n=1 Tax=Eucyclogobius newberryi TaxID=166745 RepID=UPI003B5C635E